MDQAGLWLLSKIAFWLFDTPEIDICENEALCVLEVNAHARGKFLMPKSLEPHPVDVHVGQRVAVRRKLLKLSQTDLANHVGYSYQQVQKYEHGTNRVSASVLYEFSGALGVPVSFFFQRLPTKKSRLSRLKKKRAPTDFASDPMRKPDVIKLVRAFDSITDPEARKKMLEAVRSAADALAPER